MQNGEKDLPERTYQYGRRVIALFEALPETKLAHTLGQQLLRSGTSVGAIIAKLTVPEAKLNDIPNSSVCILH
jgi:hypothetical protein